MKKLLIALFASTDISMLFTTDVFAQSGSSMLIGEEFL